jgi:hypothetical protein
MLAQRPSLKEIYLNGRCYTWSNGQSPLTLVHLDHFFCTSDREDSHVGCHLRCLASVVSDQSPLLLDCTPMLPAHRRFRSEKFFAALPRHCRSRLEFLARHGSLPSPHASPASHRTQAHNLERETVGSVKQKLAIARNANPKL